MSAPAFDDVERVGAARLAAEAEKVKSRSSSNLAFVVLGMHRSGTSAMARVLALSGAALPVNMLPPQPDNPTGFWEPKDLVDLNDSFLASVDSAWDDIFCYDQRTMSGLVNKHNKTLGLAALKQNYGDAPAIVLKDPRVSLLAPLWDDILKSAGYEPIYVVMVRHPLEVAESLRRRNGFPLGKSLLLWTSYMLAAERETRGLPRVFIDFEALSTRPLSVLDRIEERARVSLPRRTKLAANTIEQFVDSSLHHHRFSRNDIASRSDIWEVVTDLYDWFSAASVSAEGHAPAEILTHCQTRMDEVFAAAGAAVADLRAQNAHLGALLANSIHSAGVVAQQADQVQDTWQAERMAFLARQEESEATALRLSADLASATDLLAEQADRLAAQQAETHRLDAERRLALEAAEAEQRRVDAIFVEHNEALAVAETERQRLESVVTDQLAMIAAHDVQRQKLETTAAEQSAAIAAGQAERQRLQTTVSEQLAAMAAGEAERRQLETLAETRLTALEIKQAELRASAEELVRREAEIQDQQAALQIKSADLASELEARSESEAAVALLRLHIVAAQAECERLEIFAHHVETVERPNAAASLAAVERDSVQRRNDAAAQWSRERAALVGLLSNREHRINQLEEGLAAALLQADERMQVEDSFREAQDQIGSILRSRSWLVTKPLRVATRFARRGSDMING